MSETEDPQLLGRAGEVTAEDIRALAGASTPHFALQMRNRIQRLIESLPAGHPARVEGEHKITYLEDLAKHSGDPRETLGISREVKPPAPEPARPPPAPPVTQQMPPPSPEPASEAAVPVLEASSPESSAPIAHELQQATAGTYAVRLAMTFSTWVHRRVELFEFVDAETVRRQMSVDLTLPHEEGLPSEEPTEVAVPVMVLGKELLRGFDVTDASGKSLNVLDSEESRELAQAGLEEMLAKVARIDTGRVSGELLREILAESPARARELAETALADHGAIGRVLQGGDPAAVATLKALIKEMASGFMLLVYLTYHPGSRQLVKFSYAARIDGAAERMQGWAKLRARAYRMLNRLLSSLGLVGREESFGELAVRFAKSYHAEILPAPGTYSGEATLEVEGLEGRPVLRERDNNPSRPHLRVGGGGQRTNRGERGRLAVVLHARRDGLIFPLFFSAAVIAAVLAFVVKQDDQLDGITLGALLLAPVALAAYYARSEENGYLTMAMRGVRGLATLSIIAGITVIALLALGYLDPHAAEGQPPIETDPSAVEITRWAARVALVVSDALLLALISPTASGWMRRLLWPLAQYAERNSRKQLLRAAGLAGVLCSTLLLLGIGWLVAWQLFRLLPV